MVKIEFFLHDVSLGKFECVDLSTHEDRDYIAVKNGIIVYDKVILDSERVILTLNNSCYVDPDGKVWNINQDKNKQDDKSG